MAAKALKVNVANNTAKAKLGYHAEVDIGGVLALGNFILRFFTNGAIEDK